MIRQKRTCHLPLIKRLCMALCLLLLMLTACSPSPPEAPQAPMGDAPLMAARAIKLNPGNDGFSPESSPPIELLDPLILKDVGFGQAGDQVGFGFIVENPNPHRAIRNSKYDITAYDEDGMVTGTSSSYIAVIQPYQTVGIGGKLRVDEGKAAARVEVQIMDGYPEAPGPSPAFETGNLSYTQGEQFSHLSGILTNPSQDNFTTLQVSALLYDSAGAIIGGGFTFLNFINAGSSVGVRVLVKASGDVASYDIFANFSASTLLRTEAVRPSDSAELRLEKAGFGQEVRRVGYAFILSNPNSHYSVESAEYNLTAYSSEDHVLGVDSGTINRLTPNQTLGVGGNFIIGPDESVNRIEVHIRQGAFVDSQPLPFFSAENIDYARGAYSSTVRAALHNPFPQAITNLRVSAVLYDDTGAIIGGGFTFLDLAIAGTKTPVEVFVYSDREPAHAELYGTITILSEAVD